MLELGENIFVSERLAVRIDIGVPAGDVKERSHLLDVVRNDESMRLAGRLECVVAWGGDPVVLEVAPSSAQREGMHRSGMAVARQHARRPNPQDVDVIALAHVQHERPERDGVRLRDPFALVAVKLQRGADECVRDHARGLRFLIRDFALINRSALGRLLLLRFGFTCGPTSVLSLHGTHGCDRHPAFPAPLCPETLAECANGRLMRTARCWN